MKTIIINLIYSILLITTAYAQSDSLFPMESSRFDLTYDSTKNIIDSTRTYIRVFTSTSNIYGVKKVLSLNDTSLIIRKDSNSLKLNINDIKSVKFYHGTKFFEGMLSGALAGIATSLWFHSFSGDSSFTGFIKALGAGVIIAVPLAVIGGIIGLFIKDSHSYNFNGLTPEKKTAKLIRIFRQYRN